MAIKRYQAIKDNTITNALKGDLTTSGTGSNMGAADILEVFSIYGQASASAGLSQELSRVLVEFSTKDILSDRSSSAIPEPGKVNFRLKVFNAKHSETLPRGAILNVSPISSSWQEGSGLDMESYSDITKDNASGSNWVNANNNFAAAKLANAIDCTGVNNDHAFTLTSPTAMGGDGVTYTFKFVHDTAAINAGAAGNIYYIARDGLTDAQRASACADAINGVANANVAFSDGNASSVNSTDLKIKATAPGTGGGATIDLEFDNNGGIGNGHSNVLAATNGFTGTKILESEFTGGDGQWTNIGGDFVTGSNHLPSSGYSDYVKDVVLENGTENLNIDITNLVEAWLRFEHEDASGEHGDASSKSERAAFLTRDDAIRNYGLAIRLTSSHEAYYSASLNINHPGPEIHNLAGATRSFFTKKFFARSSQFFYKRPIIEAQWNDSLSDDAGNFFLSSSLADEENLNTLYLYNYVRGKLRNIPSVGTNKIGLTLHTGSHGDDVYGGKFPIGSALHHNQHPTGSVQYEGDQLLTASFVSTGIYSASFAYSSASINRVFPVWRGLGDFHDEGKYVSPDNIFFTGSVIKVKTHDTFSSQPTNEYVTKITNLKPSYTKDENPRLRLYARQKGWSPTVYTKASTEIENTTLERSFYKVFREVDGLTVIDYGTGSAENFYSKLSYDASGSYFDLDMSLMEPGYSYAIKILIDIDDYKKEQPEIFRFRVEN